MIREPVVAGQFYPLHKDDLLKQLEQCFSISGKPGKTKNENKIVATICPHAGYMYSGSTAAYSYKALKEDRTPETFVILGPNHSGIGPGVSIYPKGEWETPLGKIEVDAELAKKISDIDFMLDTEAHAYEHSIEVQMPFLQYVYETSFKIVAVCLMDQRLDSMKKLGKKLSEVLNPEKHVVIASTDFSHYVPYQSAYERDLKAINTIKKLDENELFDTISKFDVSMCGPGAVVAAIVYAKSAGAKSGEILKYQTSGDVTGDKSAVVGYGALVLKK